MSTLDGQDRTGTLVEIGDVVTVFDNEMYIQEGVIVDFLYPFIDPIQVRFAGGMTVSRESREIEKVSDSKAVLWKLENL